MMVGGNVMNIALQLAGLQIARELYNNGVQKLIYLFIYFSSRLLVISSKLAFTPLLLFMRSPLILDSQRTSHSLLCLCTRFFFLLSGKYACCL
jgi:hypothetical protein